MTSRKTPTRRAPERREPTPEEIKQAGRLYALAVVAHMELTGECEFQSVRQAAIERALQEIEGMGYSVNQLLNEESCLKAVMEGRGNEINEMIKRVWKLSAPEPENRAGDLIRWLTAGARQYPGMVKSPKVESPKLRGTSWAVKSPPAL